MNKDAIQSPGMPRAVGTGGIARDISSNTFAYGGASPYVGDVTSVSEYASINAQASATAAARAAA
ncbi:MAG: hypothetical protein H0W02_03455 [Ktedonobacteraceae bacterium]|nr:hypothetical protein [Ktedonobacteraceae bacterium]